MDNIDFFKEILDKINNDMLGCIKYTDRFIIIRLLELEFDVDSKLSPLRKPKSHE